MPEILTPRLYSLVVQKLWVNKLFGLFKSVKCSQNKDNEEMLPGNINKIWVLHEVTCIAYAMTRMLSNELHSITDVRRTADSVDEMHQQTQLN